MKKTAKPKPKTKVLKQKQKQTQRQNITVNIHNTKPKSQRKRKPVEQRKNIPNVSIQPPTIIMNPPNYQMFSPYDQIRPNPLVSQPIPIASVYNEEPTRVYNRHNNPFINSNKDDDEPFFKPLDNSIIKRDIYEPDKKNDDDYEMENIDGFYKIQQDKDENIENPIYTGKIKKQGDNTQEDNTKKERNIYKFYNTMDFRTIQEEAIREGLIIHINGKKVKKHDLIKLLVDKHFL